MRVVFRADANTSIGMGHVMRSLSVADAFADAGNIVCFVLADDSVQSLVKGRGYETIVLNSDYSYMDDELNSLPQGFRVDLLIVDSYYVTDYYLRAIRDKMVTAEGKLVYIDDILAFPYPVDILVNYNAYADEEEYRKLYSGCSVIEPEYILGVTYAPLRGMFRVTIPRVQPKKVKNVLISTGGSDRMHLSLSLIDRISSDRNKEMVYHFLVGEMNEDKENIQKKADSSDFVILHENVQDMRSLICSCDLVISAAGSTLYEVASCGVPLITYSFADNQIPGAEAFERMGIGINAGDLRDPEGVNLDQCPFDTLYDVAVDRILTVADELSIDYKYREEMGKRMQEMIDGCGADRMVQKIMQLWTRA